MELTGKITGMTLDFKTGKPFMTLQINEKQDAMLCYDKLHAAEKVSIKISKYREKRSNDANAYFWVLCDKLAAEIKMPKVDIYRDLIRNIGDNCEIIPLRNDAVDKFIENWGKDSNGRKRLGWICDIIGASKIEGYTNVCAYYGSSTYDKAQMGVLIDNIIEACQEQNIQVKTPAEIARLKSLWGESNNG